ncbi:redoxin domain-containing protein [Hymenobacter caeli]|uniref:thioredoxin-dependent peroxiredoxin n=1 Tax=Hymenobacter caeli TaxID=2735894 RepID=A0ABX2FRM6_9BACT|nr:redoxin domain-containing protein [Hymenobacter caeli]NRT19646.1 peroxiredoxin [Hymenobacter caeli]
MNYSLALVLASATVLTGQAQTVKTRPPAALLAMQGNAAAPAPAPASVPAPTYRLTGRVFDPDGEPLPGATLLLKGTSQVVSTDATGSFALDLPVRTLNTLVAGYAGCDDLVLNVAANQPQLSVHLSPSLDEGLGRALRVGDLAPDFYLPTTTGATFKLSEHRGHPVVLYFYPKDGSSGCTKEACSFRDQYEDFTALGAEVIGISSDSERSHRQFTAKYDLPFPLLSDKGGQLRSKYAVPRAVLGLLPGRVTYVLDGEGRVRYVFNSLNEATDHVANAKTILRDIQ